jgi:hypothetical protein
MRRSVRLQREVPMIEEAPTFIVVAANVGWLVLAFIVVASAYTARRYVAVGRLGPRALLPACAASAVALAGLATLSVWSRMDPSVPASWEAIVYSFGLYGAVTTVAFCGATLALRRPIVAAAAARRLTLQLFARGVAGFLFGAGLLAGAALAWDVVRVLRGAAA